MKRTIIIIFVLSAAAAVLPLTGCSDLLLQIGPGTGSGGSSTGDGSSDSSGDSGDFTLTYKANGADSGTPPPPLSADNGDSVTISENTGKLSRASYVTLEWNTAADGSGTYYLPGQTVTISSNLTLYARWRAGAHVSKTGSDSNNGSLASPFLTIGKALLETSDGAAVLVSAGTYAEEVIISNDVSLYGGFVSDFSSRAYKTASERSASANKTRIKRTATTGGAESDPMGTLRYQSGAGSDMHTVEGFTIDAPTGSAGGAVAAIEVDDSSSPLIRFCTITGSPDNTPARSFGIHVIGDPPKIADSDINGGYSATTSYAVYMHSGTAVSFAMTNNLISGGSSSGSITAVYIDGYTTGVISENTVHLGTPTTDSNYMHFNSCGLTVSRNTISGGTLATNIATGIFSTNNKQGMTIKSNMLNINTGGSVYGLSATQSTGSTDIAHVYNNVVKLHGGSTSTWVIGLTGSASENRFYNNTVSISATAGGGIGINFTGATADPYISNNIFYLINIAGTKNSIFYGSGATAATVTETRTTNNCFFVNGTDSPSAGFIGVNSNIDSDPELDSDLKLKASSPAAVKTGGVDLSSYFTTDKDNVTRTSWSMGAFVAP